jgi:hypothetical protein
MFPVVLIRLVVQVLELCFRRDGGVDLLLPGDPRLPPVGVRRPGDLQPLSIRRRGSSFVCHFSQMTSISVLLAIEPEVMYGDRR